MSIRIDGTNTTANPGITGSDTDTGLQFGTNEVKVVTDGTDRVTVDSSGNVGIGVTSLASSSRLTLLESAGNAQTLEIKGANTGGSGSQPGIKLTASNGDNIGGFFADTNADELRIQTGGTDRILISNAGRMILTDNCTGIQFGDDDTGTNITSQTLDDYEEGTFSPSITFGGGASGMTLGENSGHYTKIGRLVVCNILVSFSAKGSSTGNAKLTGLPFTVASHSEARTQGHFTYQTGMANLTSVVLLYGTHNTTETNMMDTNTSSHNMLDDTNFTNSSVFRAILTYYTA